MNKYGQLLRRQWESADPRFVQSLSDPTEHFSQMGEQAQNEILELLPSLEGTDPAGETYLQKVGRLNAARTQAEEIVLEEYQPPSDSPEPGEPEDWDSMSPDQQESWVKENVPAGEQHDEMMRQVQAYRNNRIVVLGASYDPETDPQD
ncbi:MAG: TnpV protein [Kocuria sp.]|nr:TnpV protein [Kocuria sp.]